MFSDTTLVFVLIAAAGVLMASGRIRFDAVALLAVLALMLTGVLSVDEALSGFGSPVVALVAGLLVIGEMLSRTGVARAVGDWILSRGGNHEARLLALVMAGAALLGSVMSSTVVVALFIPIVLRIAAATGLNASRMLIPLSYASLISGMLTLIATTPNIIVHQQLKSAGFDGFGFFSFSPVGLAVFSVALIYILLAGRFMLGPRQARGSDQPYTRSLQDLWQLHSPHAGYRKVKVLPGSPLVGKTIAEAQLETRYHLRIVGVVQTMRSHDDTIVIPQTNYELVARNILYLVGPESSIDQLIEEQKLAAVAPGKIDQQRWMRENSGAAVLIHPESQLLGKSLREIGFRSDYGVHVLGMRRNFHAVEDFENVPLHAADSLFVVGPRAKLKTLANKSYDFVITEYPSEHHEPVSSRKHMRISLLILLAFVLLTLFEVVPLVAAVIIASLAAIFTRCLTMEEAYRSIHWSSLVLIAGMLPMARALEKTGGTQLITDLLVAASSHSGPYLLMTLLFFITASIGLVLSNTAAAVLMAPIAVYAATGIGASPYPFAVAVLIAASSSFSTPVATPVVTLVVDPGRYKFIDFVKVGVPLLLLTYLTTLVTAPWVFPFFPEA
ncbi:SLC13 family permease [Halioxenophilus sp. WMMB6]|uniref:SLC13 family permease n=1 Tax=Halioxenophilus sp. WMMB6 TaxID=3073815 RepID=UPI00295F1520|nr:SLC13 family permease [Halioxenophilus sp. WMMB6]